MRIIRRKSKSCENCSHIELNADHSVCVECIESQDKFNFAPKWSSGVQVSMIGTPDQSLRDDNEEEEDNNG